ncbi:hypothetical protein NDU88_000636 [Pleurodeles waltl]|uniref:Uncharacterized protein n=1 Tax=Pleurodeles waltl TaxID=8319 RepID=A0AAV7U4J6_PLEWA|nr:hypothetical protein NDU88_000636 [Pleurodeles waltl]
MPGLIAVCGLRTSVDGLLNEKATLMINGSGFGCYLMRMAPADNIRGIKGRQLHGWDGGRKGESFGEGGAGSGRNYSPP